MLVMYLVMTGGLKLSFADHTVNICEINLNSPSSSKTWAISCANTREGRMLYTQNGIKFESTEIRVTDRKKDRLGGGKSVSFWQRMLVIQQHKKLFRNCSLKKNY